MQKANRWVTSDVLDTRRSRRENRAALMEGCCNEAPDSFPALFQANPGGSMPIPTLPAPMFRPRLLSLAAALSLLASSLAMAQAGAPVTAETSTAAATKDAAVLKRLAEVGATLRALKHFAVKADALTDEVLLSGQKLQFASSVEYQFAGPDKLRASVRSDRRQRDYYFDGKTFTQVALRAGYYASVPLAGTLGEAMTVVAQRYDIEIPLADLFLWGTPRSGLEDVTSALLVGPARIGGVDCDHFALRQPGVDWQVWVERGPRALPLKWVITTTDEPAQPQYAATLKWDLKATPAASSFTYVPAKGVHRIELKPVAAAK
jgi:hypothetical protein